MAIAPTIRSRNSPSESELGKATTPPMSPTAAATPAIDEVGPLPRSGNPTASGPNVPPRTGTPTQPPLRSTKLSWHAQTKGTFPRSNAFGETIRISFVNRHPTPVELEWIDRTGNRKSYGMIDTGKSKEMNTYGGTIWLISDDSGKPLGYFSIGSKSEIAEVPAKKGSVPLDMVER